MLSWMHRQLFETEGKLDIGTGKLAACCDCISWDVGGELGAKAQGAQGGQRIWEDCCIMSVSSGKALSTFVIDASLSDDDIVGWHAQ